MMMKRNKREGRGWMAGILAACMLVIIVTGSLLPQSMKNSLAKDVQSRMDSVCHVVGISGLLARCRFYFRPNPAKIAHFIAFALFAVALACWRSRCISVLIAATVIAGGSECVQIFIRGRTPTFHDILIDLAGTCTGILAYSLFCGRVEKKMTKDGK
jgi:VanZ family protein